MCYVAEPAQVRVWVRRERRTWRVARSPGDAGGRVRSGQVLCEPAEQRAEGRLLRGRLGLPPTGAVSHVLRQLVHEHAVRAGREGSGSTLSATRSRESLSILLTTCNLQTQTLSLDIQAFIGLYQII